MLATMPDSPHGSTTPVLRLIRDVQRVRVLPRDFPLRVLTVGVQYGTQSAVVEDVMVDLMPLPVVALDPDSEAYTVLEDVVREAESLRVAANRLGDDLRLSSGGDKLPWDKGSRLGDEMVHEFNPAVRSVLTALQRFPEAVDEAQASWRADARGIALAAAERVLNTVSPETFLGRVESAPMCTGRALPKPVSGLRSATFSALVPSWQSQRAKV